MFDDVRFECVQDTRKRGNAFEQYIHQMEFLLYLIHIWNKFAANSLKFLPYPLETYHYLLSGLVNANVVSIKLTSQFGGFYYIIFKN